MAEQTYSYAVASDFPNHAVDAGRLHEEVSDSAIVTALVGVGVKGDSCDVTFKAALSAGDKTLLDGIVAVHTGAPQLDPTTLDGKPVIHIDAPLDGPDQKPVFVLSPAPEGWMTYFVGRGDDAGATPPASGRGTGDPIRIEFLASDTYPKDESAEWSYIEPTYVHDGQLTWKNPDDFDANDHFSLCVRIPANTPTANGSNAGNCNVVPTGLGYSVIVPAAGDGAYDIDLSTAVPAPAGLDQNGYWDVNERTGTVSPSKKPGNSWWHLLDVEVKSYFIRSIPLNHPVGVYDVDVYKTEWVSERWFWRMEAHKENAPSEDANLAGWLLIFRENAT